MKRRWLATFSVFDVVDFPLRPNSPKPAVLPDITSCMFYPHLRDRTGIGRAGSTDTMIDCHGMMSAV